MVTQTRRTIRRSARFFRATVTASMVAACCGLILWSAVVAHAGVQHNGIELNGLTENGILVNGMPFNGLNPNGVTINGLHVNGLNPNGLSQNGILVNGMLRNAQPSQAEMPPGGQRDSLPFHSLSQRALGKAAASAMSDDRSTLPVELPTAR
jgi:hypothetical protein